MWLSTLIQIFAFLPLRGGDGCRFLSGMSTSKFTTVGHSRQLTPPTRHPLARSFLLATNMNSTLLMPQIDCEMSIGHDMFTFYFPIEIGEFVLTLWTRPNLRSSDIVFSLTIFEHGSRISARDSRFSSHELPWASKLFHSWEEEAFNRSEVDQIIADLQRISGAPESS